MTTNPFEVLRLSADATEEEIVRQGARLAQQAADEPTRNAIREAVRALTDDPAARRVFALLTPPGPPGGNELDRFIAAHRRPPTPDGPLQVPPLDEQELRELLRQAMAAELNVAPPPYQSVPAGESTDEIDRQTGEAMWQSLLIDPRG
jgi:hypothetical protein